MSLHRHVSRFAFAAVIVAVVGAACGGGYVHIMPGRPAFAPGAPVSYWIWHDEAGWHLRTTTMAMLHRFEGTVSPAGGEITGLRATRPEWNDRITAGPAGITFAFETQGDMDGFDWRVSSGCNQFDLRVDGAPAPNLVHVGVEARNPEMIPFVRCR